MATMMKEKRREKKKSKEKQAPRSSTDRDPQPILEEKHPIVQDTPVTEIMQETALQSIEGASSSIEKTSVSSSEASTSYLDNRQVIKHSEFVDTSAEISKIESSLQDRNIAVENKLTKENLEVAESTEIQKSSEITHPSEILLEMQSKEKMLQNKQLEIGNTYQDLNDRLERITIPSLDPNLDIEPIESRLNNPAAYITQESEPAECKTQGSSMEIGHNEHLIKTEIQEDIIPSAPMFEEPISAFIENPQVVERNFVKVKTECMPLEEAVRLYGGKEMAEVRAISEREEAIVEAGPTSGPEHPLVDLLSTFRSSLRAVERERTQLARGFAEEEKSRNTLWKVEKKTITVSEECPCGLSVHRKFVFEQAELMKGRLPVAKMKLEGLLRDLQDSYCHYQHAALLAHCQIEDLISETIKSNKNEIREALALILQALRLSDGAPAATALQRWAAVLSAALVDQRDLRQLVHLMQHLFRQTRSVKWAARVLHVSVNDRSGAARAIALLELLLARPRLEPALECTEDTEEGWEEVDKRGGGGAVSEGTLRERDLLTLLRAFPLRNLVARLVLITNSDISKVREDQWGDTSGGHGVLQSCCGVRALLHVVQRAVSANPQYSRLHRELRALAASALHALAGLHLSTSYSPVLEEKVSAELHACFAAGVSLCDGRDIHTLPATLLADGSAKDYCVALIAGLHEKTPKQLEDLSIELPSLPCEDRVRIVGQAALDRTLDNELARIVLDFLMQTGVKRKATQCKGACDVTAREMLPPLLAVHPYLHTMAFYILADFYQVEPLEPSAVKPLSLELWRPSPGEVATVLEDWSARCPAMVQYLLVHLDYTPNSGLCLETQLKIGSWLCEYERTNQQAPEWLWTVLRRIRVHRTFWNLPLDAPPPDPEPSDLFSTAYALLASSWGHCVPLICSEGVSALCRLATLRPREAVHCLGPIMIVMAHSPESISFTPKFNELLTTLLNSGPTMVQRALGRGPEPGAALLTRLMLTQLDNKSSAGIPRSMILSAWQHAVWRIPLPGAAAMMDTALLATMDWPSFDAFATHLMQEENVKEHISAAVRNASVAPLIAECVLRAAHTQYEVATQLWARLCDALHGQRTAGVRVHVDNALKNVGASITSEELVIHRLTSAVLASPIEHPSQLTLLRLLLRLYLQRPPCSLHESTPPVGPLFFSGIIKSRTFTQLKRRLLETIIYHNNQIEILKQEIQEQTKKKTSSEVVATKIEKPVRSTEDGLLSNLSMRDLTGESSESEDTSQSEEERDSIKEERVDSLQIRDVNGLLSFHVAADKMVREYLRWLDEGEKTRAAPHHVDMPSFLSSLEAAWKQELSRRKDIEAESPPATPLTTPLAPPIAPQRALSPLQSTLRALRRIKVRSRYRSRRPSIKSPLEEANFSDARVLLSLVEKHLIDIEALAREWSKEVSRISSLDAALWDLVCALRVSRPLPVVKLSCANKCKPVTLTAQEREWCISTGAERGIQENRRSASAGIRRLARPRPHAARAAAALHAVARHVGSAATARRVCDRACKAAAAAGATHCAPARAALTALVDLLAERWICHDARLCCELLSQWTRADCSPLQQSLCGALICPRRLPVKDWSMVYIALLKAKLPEHAAFSYLSKFEMGWWGGQAAASRREVLEALAQAVQRFGCCPAPTQHVLLELIGVHTATLLNPADLPAHVTSCARASVSLRLPPTHWAHIVRAADIHGVHVPFDQLGHLLRELGVIWWEARSELQGRKPVNYEMYAPHMADLLRSLQRAFVANALALSYAPERVALYAWSSLQESWSPWISPLTSVPPLLPCIGDDEAYTPMLRRFVDDIQLIMADCPGIEERLLQQIFDWTIQTYMSVKNTSSQETSIQLSTLLIELRQLPWTDYQWMCPDSLQVALQIASSSDKEITSWCAMAWKATAAVTWLRDVTDDTLAPRLAALLYLFTAMTHSPQTLEEATYLPWWRLPSPALEEALERFFAQYHNTAIPYHDNLQFRVLLYAAELSIRPEAPPPSPVSASSRIKRSTAVSVWVRAATSPALLSHVGGHCSAVLNTITDIAPHIEQSEGEIEELLSRAVIIMCMEPAANAALPKWQEWLSRTPSRVTAGCLSAAAVLTTFEYFAALADTAVKQHLAHKESTGWQEIRHRWQNCPWQDSAPLAARSRLHAAYAVIRSHEQSHEQLRTAFLALLAADINFLEEEPIAAVWICSACRVARGSPTEGQGAECGEAARTLLKRWAETGRRSLLKLVTLQADSSTPTPRHRLLARLALCILTPNESTFRGFEAACTEVPAPDVLSWGRTPNPKRLPRLAMRLFPNHEVYLRDELDMAPENL